MRILESPLRNGFHYPCSIEDIGFVCGVLGESLLEGLNVIALANPKSKRDSANARYFRSPYPRIVIYSINEQLCYILGATKEYKNYERLFDIELSFGMKLEIADNKVMACWSSDCLRRFICCHVLLHEIGHHVYRRERHSDLSPAYKDYNESEKHASHFAKRYQEIVERVFV